MDLSQEIMSRILIVLWRWRFDYWNECDVFRHRKDYLVDGKRIPYCPIPVADSKHDVIDKVLAIRDRIGHSTIEGICSKERISKDHHERILLYHKRSPGIPAKYKREYEFTYEFENNSEMIYQSQSKFGFLSGSGTINPNSFEGECIKREYFEFQWNHYFYLRPKIEKLENARNKLLFAKNNNSNDEKTKALTDIKDILNLSEKDISKLLRKSYNEIDIYIKQLIDTTKSYI